MTPSSENIGHSDLFFTVQIDVHQRSNNQHTPLGNGKECAIIHHNFMKKAKNVYLMTPSSTNIGHNDLVLVMHIKGHMVSDKQHRPLSYCQISLHRPLTHSEKRLNGALDDPIFP